MFLIGMRGAFFEATNCVLWIGCPAGRYFDGRAAALGQYCNADRGLSALKHTYTSLLLHNMHKQQGSRFAVILVEGTN
jgi:hypothetical protein